MNPEIIRKARAAGYHVHYLQPTQVAKACAQLCGNKPLPAFAVLRKD